eukprot:UN14549
MKVCFFLTEKPGVKTHSRKNFSDT